MITHLDLIIVSVIFGFPVNRVPVNVAIDHRIQNTIVRQVRTANVFFKKEAFTSVSNRQSIFF